jgi:hypothetical protein
MDIKIRAYNQNILIGCGSLILLAIVAGMIWLGFLLQQSRQATHYPGARLVSSHSNYTRLPRRFKWDESYRTTDKFTEVLNWYSHALDLGGEIAAMERCIYLDSSSQQGIVSSYTGVFICDSTGSTLVFVSRTTSFGD